MITLWNLVLAGIVFLISRKIFGRKKLGKTPPGPTPLPFVGNALSFGKALHLTINKWSEQYGKIYQMYMLDKRTVVLSDVELAKKAYQIPALQGRPRLEMMEYEGVRHGIMLTSGQEWQEQRRFTLRHLRDFGFGKNYMESLILDEVDELIEWLKSQEGKPVSINRKFYLAVINSLWTILSGKRYSHTDPKLGRVFELLIT
ncbi:unnamed protein product [Allacma fusca]|uniref:Cytochrome P450 n=2 Tax=Allacma fusca TaxID=39272 RepID=A0A8J2KYY8_9HEXA|nr:unnamed protein product [Allacma fusca]